MAAASNGAGNIARPAWLIKLIGERSLAEPTGRSYKEVLAYIEHELRKELLYYRWLAGISVAGLIWWGLLFCIAFSQPASTGKPRHANELSPARAKDSALKADTAAMAEASDSQVNTFWQRIAARKPGMREVPGAIWPILTGAFSALEIAGRKKKLYALMATRFTHEGRDGEDAALREQMRLTIWEHFTASDDGSWDGRAQPS